MEENQHWGDSHKWSSSESESNQQHETSFSLSDSMELMEEIRELTPTISTLSSTADDVYIRRDQRFIDLQRINPVSSSLNYSQNKENWNPTQPRTIHKRDSDS